MCAFTRTSYLLYVGHPIPARLSIPTALGTLQDELSLNELHQQPIQLLGRVLLINTMVLLRLLYRTQYLPLTDTQLVSFAKIMERFVFGVLGMPTVIELETLCTHRTHGLGFSYFPTLHPTRVLDVLHRNQHILSFSTSPHSTMSPYALFLDAVFKFGPAPIASMTPLDVTWQSPGFAHHESRDSRGVGGTVR